MIKNTEIEKKSFTISMRYKIFIGVSLLCSLLILTLGRDALQNYNQYTLTVQLKTMNELGDRLIQSAELFQSERGYINSALNNPEPSQNDFLERIKTLDLKGNVFLSSALADLPQSFKNKNEAALKRLEKSTNDFKRFQRESINAISLPDSKRPAHLKILWHPYANELIEQVEALWVRFNYDMSNKDSFALQLNLIKQSAFSLRDIAGRERALLETMIVSGDKLSADDLLKITEYETKIKTLLENIQDINKRLDQPFNETLNGIDLHYGQKYEILRRNIIAKSTNNLAYDISLKEWREISEPAMKSLLDLKSNAVEILKNRANKKAIEAYSNAKNYTIELMSGLVLGLLIIWYINNRIIKTLSELKSITIAMTKIQDGNLETLVPHVQDKGDIGLVAKAVQELKINLESKAAFYLKEKQDIENKEMRQIKIDMIITNFQNQVDISLKKFDQSLETIEKVSNTLVNKSTDTKKRITDANKDFSEACESISVIAISIAQLTSSTNELSLRSHDHKVSLDEAYICSEETRKNSLEFATTSKTIKSITQNILQIANTSNMLALNAMIEAKSAKEAGNEFRVIADEMKKLSNTTTEKASLIDVFVQNVLQKTDITVQNIEKTDTLLETVASYGGAIAAAVYEHKTAIHEISHSAERSVLSGLKAQNELNKANQCVAETDLAVQEANTASRDMIAESLTVKKLITDFLSSVKAA